LSDFERYLSKSIHSRESVACHERPGIGMPKTSLSLSRCLPTPVTFSASGPRVRSAWSTPGWTSSTAAAQIGFDAEPISIRSKFRSRK
jgi:hypothetical protein